VTAVPVTSADEKVQLVSDPTEEFCNSTLYCGFNVSDVDGVQLQTANSSSNEDWITIYSINTTANSSVSTKLLRVSRSYRIYKYSLILLLPLRPTPVILSLNMLIG